MCWRRPASMYYRLIGVEILAELDFQVVWDTLRTCLDIESQGFLIGHSEFANVINCIAFTYFAHPDLAVLPCQILGRGCNLGMYRLTGAAKNLFQDRNIDHAEVLATSYAVLAGDLGW